MHILHTGADDEDANILGLTSGFTFFSIRTFEHTGR